MAKFLLLGVVILVAQAVVSAKYAAPIFPEDVQESFISRIVNGYPAVNGQFPWQVAIQGTRGTQTFVCGGSLISARKSFPKIIQPKFLRNFFFQCGCLRPPIAQSA
jgi:Trypsin